MLRCASFHNIHWGQIKWVLLLNKRDYICQVNMRMLSLWFHIPYTSPFSTNICRNLQIYECELHCKFLIMDLYQADDLGGSGVLLQLVWSINFLQSCSGEYMANLKSSTTPAPHPTSPSSCTACSRGPSSATVNINDVWWGPVSPSQSTNMPDKLRVYQMDGEPWI